VGEPPRVLWHTQNVVRIMGYNTMVKPYFVVMELVYGWSLRREVAKRGPIPLDMVHTAFARSPD
jgi:hypothetical protein